MKVLGGLSFGGFEGRARRIAGACSLFFAMPLLALWLASAPPAAAGYDEGAAAFIRGDYETAWEEWLALGKRGHQSAQYNLGVLYAIGLGVPQDQAEAVKWFRRAADRGLPAAQMRLGAAYRDGKGVPADLKTAYFWFTLAATHFSLGEQHDRAVAARERAGASLTRAQITEVLEKAMVWKPLPQTVAESEKERLITGAEAENGHKALNGDSGHQQSGLTVTGQSQPTQPAPQPAQPSQSAQPASPQDEQPGTVPLTALMAAVGPREEPKPASPAPAGQATPSSEPPSPESPSPEPASQTAAVPAPTFVVHLSSVRSQDGAGSEWRQLRERFPDLLSGQELTVRSVELEGQGTFYRILTGAFDDYDEAQAYCARFKAQDQYCLAIRLSNAGG